MIKTFYTYLMSNEFRTVIYTGTTGDMKRRVYEHKNKLIPGFTKTYNATRLVYVETHAKSSMAIRREKQIKAGSRAKKIELIESQNPLWKDLTPLQWLNDFKNFPAVTSPKKAGDPPLAARMFYHPQCN